MAAEHLPHPTTEVNVTGVLELAERPGYPAVQLPGETIAAGRNAWGAWVASASRLQLAQEIGMLTARVHRESRV